MNLWTGVHFICFAVYFFSIFYVIVKKPYSTANWVLAVLFGYFALWSACSCILDNTSLSFAKADLVMKIQSIGWANFISYYLLFILYQTNNKKILSTPVFVISIILLPFVFIFENYNGQMLDCCHPVSYGIAGIWKSTPWAYLFFFYYTPLFIISTVMLSRFKNSTRGADEKRMANILLWSSSVVFLIGTVNSVIMNYMKLSNPIDTNVVFLIFVGGYIYCAEKYDTLTLTGTKNADRIMDLINEGIILFDGNDRIITTNRAAMDIFGFQGGSRANDAYEFIEKLIKSSGAVCSAGINNLEFDFNDAAGCRKEALLSSNVMLKNNIDSGKIFTVRDVTGKKKAAENLMDTVKELRRSNEELENFAYVASHDLKEPLRMVNSYVQLIRKKFQDKLGNDGNDYINFAAEGAIRMSNLIEGLLEYSRVKKTGKEHAPVDISEILTRVSDTLKLCIRDKNALIEARAPLPVIMADSIQMEQLFRNIIGNAIKFSGKNPPAITISCENREKIHVFAIKDNGIGIDMRYSQKIFQIFQQLNGRQEYEGTGMGLAICKKIVESHGGNIWVESGGLGSGCSFFFTIPQNGGSNRHLP